MTRYHIVLEYDGGGFSGWQRQSNAPSVQAALEEALFAMSGERATVTAAGRTDAGVHALAMHAHFDLDAARPAAEIRGALNHHLRARDARAAVLQAQETDNRFHARFSAIRRHYAYRIVSRAALPALERGHVLHLRNPLSLAAMQEAAAALQGEHDFSSFRASGCQAKSPIKRIDSISVRAVQDALCDGSELQIAVSAPSFLYNQVRIIVGSLVLVGLGRWRPGRIAAVLAAKERARAGPTAPAHGLYFAGAEYS